MIPIKSVDFYDTPFLYVHCPRLKHVSQLMKSPLETLFHVHYPPLTSPEREASLGLAQNMSNHFHKIPPEP